MKLDKTNIDIIKHLRDGRKSFKKIAEDLTIAENTVRARVEKLTSDGVFAFAGVVDALGIDGHQVVVIGVNLDSMELVKKGEEISQVKGVVSVQVVTGRFDLLVTVLLNHAFSLLNFYTEELNQVEGIRSVETFVVYKGYNFKVPYVLPDTTNGHPTPEE